MRRGLRQTLSTDFAKIQIGKIEFWALHVLSTRQDVNDGQKDGTVSEGGGGESKMISHLLLLSLHSYHHQYYIHRPLTVRYKKAFAFSKQYHLQSKGVGHHQELSLEGLKLARLAIELHNARLLLLSP